MNKETILPGNLYYISKTGIDSTRFTEEFENGEEWIRVICVEKGEYESIIQVTYVYESDKGVSYEGSYFHKDLYYFIYYLEKGDIVCGEVNNSIPKAL